MNWNQIKKKGTKHYKSGQVEPIDLMLFGNMLRDKALGDIIKYAFRNRRDVSPNMSISDLNKIIHYAEILIFIQERRIVNEGKDRCTTL